MKQQVGSVARRLLLLLFSTGSVLALSLFAPALVFACIPNQQTCSTTYGINEVFFGSGGSLCDPNSLSTSPHSTNYCIKGSAGELNVGNATSTNFQEQAGFNTDRTPSLTFIVSTAAVALSPSSTITPGTTAYGTATFSVKTYLSSGYIVATSGAAPTNSTYTINTLSSPSAANSAVEQFGINLKANNSCGGGMPASLGSDPVQVPSSAFSFGVAATGYDTACQFKYINGDTIASSSKSSGETDYTISYIINTTNVTPGGTYTMNQTLVATSTY